MPNMKNAKKAVKVNAKRTVENNNYEASMKTAIKNVERAVSNKDKEKWNEYNGQWHGGIHAPGAG